MFAKLIIAIHLRWELRPHHEFGSGLLSTQRSLLGGYLDFIQYPGWLNVFWGGSVGEVCVAAKTVAALKKISKSLTKYSRTPRTRTYNAPRHKRSIIPSIRHALFLTKTIAALKMIGKSQAELPELGHTMHHDTTDQ